MAIYRHKGVRPTLAPDVFIAPNANVIGDVHIGAGSSVWFGTLLRGDVFPIRIGARTNIQDACVVHVTGGKNQTTVGDDVTVGHMALLHGCAVGDRVLVGMGSILLDGAVVEDECIIGAGSLVVPGARIRSGSLALGRPAKAVRALKAEELEWIRASSALYAEYAKTYRSSEVEAIG